MNGDISWMHYTEINFLTRKSVRKLWKVQIFLVIKAVKFRNLQISNILTTDANIIFPIPFKVMYIYLRYFVWKKYRSK